jgi:hypothetical protein
VPTILSARCLALDTISIDHAGQLTRAILAAKYRSDKRNLAIRHERLNASARLGRCVHSRHCIRTIFLPANELGVVNPRIELSNK